MSASSSRPGSGSTRMAPTLDPEAPQLPNAVTDPQPANVVLVKKKSMSAEEADKDSTKAVAAIPTAPEEPSQPEAPGPNAEMQEQLMEKIRTKASDAASYAGMCVAKKVNINVTRDYTMNSPIVPGGNNDTWTPLLLALNNELYDVVRTLCKANPDVNVTTGMLMVTPLMMAAAMGNTEAVAAVLALKPNINELDKVGWPALAYALYRGHLAAATLLVKEGADITLLSAKDLMSSGMLQSNVDILKASSTMSSEVDQIHCLRIVDMARLVQVCQEIVATKSCQLPPEAIAFLVQSCLLAGLDTSAAGMLTFLAERIDESWPAVAVQIQGDTSKKWFDSLLDYTARMRPRILAIFLESCAMPLFTRTAQGWDERAAKAKAKDSGSGGKAAAAKEDKEEDEPELDPDDRLIAASLTIHTVFQPLHIGVGSFFVPVAYSDRDSLNGLHKKENPTKLVPPPLGEKTWIYANVCEVYRLDAMARASDLLGMMLSLMALPPWRLSNVYDSQYWLSAGFGSSEGYPDVRDPAVRSQYYAAAAMVLLHLGPCGLISSVVTVVMAWVTVAAFKTVAIVWYMLYIVLMLLFFLLMLICSPLILSWIVVKQRFLRTFVRKYKDLDFFDTWTETIWFSLFEAMFATLSGDGDAAGTYQQYNVSLSEVRVPFASTVLTAKRLGSLLNDPRVGLKLWTSPVVKSMVLLRWNMFTRHIVRTMFFVRLGYMAVFIAYTLQLEDNFWPPAGTPEGEAVPDQDMVCSSDLTVEQFWLLAVTGFMTFEYAFMELRELAREGLSQFLGQAWNLFDLAQLALVLAILALHWSCGAGLPTLRGLAAVAVLVLFWRLLYFATAIDELGAFVRMVFEVSFDLRWFFIFLAVIYSGFAIALIVLQVSLQGEEDSNDTMGLSYARPVFMRLYTMIYGDFSVDLLVEPSTPDTANGINTLTAVICSVYMLFVTIVLLNLLIAIIGDAYDRVIKDWEAHAVRSKAMLVVETEGLLPKWFKRRRDQHVFACDTILVLQHEISADTGEVTVPEAQAWMGRLGETRSIVAEELDSRIGKGNIEELVTLVKRQGELLEKQSEAIDRLMRNNVSNSNITTSSGKDNNTPTATDTPAAVSTGN